MPPPPAGAGCGVVPPFFGFGALAGDCAFCLSASQALSAFW